MRDLYSMWQNGHKDIGKAEGIIDLYEKELNTLQARLQEDEAYMRMKGEEFKAMTRQLQVAEKRRHLDINFIKNYQKAINQIDDYFEYRNESKKDKGVVLGILGCLTIAITPPEGEG